MVFAPKAHGIIDTESNVIALSSSEATLTPLANLGLSAGTFDLPPWLGELG